MRVTLAQRQRLGAAVRAARLAAGMTQERLAERVGVHPTYLPRIEAGKAAPSLPVCCAIADAVGVPVGVLVSAVDAPPARDPDGAARAELGQLLLRLSGERLGLVNDVVRAVMRRWRM